MGNIICHIFYFINVYFSISYNGYGYFYFKSSVVFLGSRVLCQIIAIIVMFLLEIFHSKNHQAAILSI